MRMSVETTAWDQIPSLVIPRTIPIFTPSLPTNPPIPTATLTSARDNAVVRPESEHSHARLTLSPSQPSPSSSSPPTADTRQPALSSQEGQSWGFGGEGLDGSMSSVLGEISLSDSALPHTLSWPGWLTDSADEESSDELSLCGISLTSELCWEEIGRQGDCGEVVREDEDAKDGLNEAGPTEANEEEEEEWSSQDTVKQLSLKSDGCEWMPHPVRSFAATSVSSGAGLECGAGDKDCAVERTGQPKDPAGKEEFG
ncbi:hypothetical protein BLNAU_6379 [Blattamonas nauphoetae]|uniref:Uncharacterized protein n=1 Tax=Blattamonas nauphoetae TaxID=2049346 RepID=A0ABQ9Y4I4_9EUKA|nr:hypothetical protein BLNAU_6379 [Blattamonas nauphoetae]